MVKRYLNTYGKLKTPKIGDFILFQEYEQDKHDGEQYHYKISKPILAIYLGYYVADQTIAFNYVKWVNNNRLDYITNEYVTNYPAIKEITEIDTHVEWDDYVDILGHWDKRPNWKEILKAYRNQNIMESVSEDEINCRY